MKYNHLFLSSILLLTVLACETKPDDKIFTLEGTVNNIPDSTLFYLRDEAGITMDSAYVTEGKLILKSDHTAKRPEKLMLLSMSPEFLYSYFLVENEHVTFKADKSDFPWNIDMKGSQSQDDAEKLNKIEYQRQQLSKKLKTKYGSDDELLTNKLNMLSDSLDTEIVKLIKGNFNSYASLNNFKYHKLSFSAQELSSLYEKLDDELKQTDMGKAVKLQSEFPKPEVGDQYYDYSAINQHGDTLSLSDIHNKYTLLHFSSYACNGSLLSLPELRELHSNYPDDLEIISISTDLDRESWEKHVKRDSVTWNYLWDGKGDYNDAYIKYWQYGTPTYVLISPEKVILENWFGYGEELIKENVTKHLKI